MSINLQITGLDNLIKGVRLRKFVVDQDITLIAIYCDDVFSVVTRVVFGESGNPALFQVER